MKHDIISSSMYHIYKLICKIKKKQYVIISILAIKNYIIILLICVIFLNSNDTSSKLCTYVILYIMYILTYIICLGFIRQ